MSLSRNLTLETTANPRLIAIRRASGITMVTFLEPTKRRVSIWITMAVYGLYYALTQPVLKALVVESVAQEVRGRALGTYFFITSVATLAASLITGELWKHYGAEVPFYFSAGLAAVSAILLIVRPPRKAHRLPAIIS